MSGEPPNADGVIAVFLWFAVFLSALMIVPHFTNNVYVVYVGIALSFVALMIPYLYRKLKGQRA